MRPRGLTRRFFAPGLLTLALFAPSGSGQELDVADLKAKWRALEQKDADNVTYKVEEKRSYEGKARPTSFWVVESSPIGGKAFESTDHAGAANAVFVWNEQYSFAMSTNKGANDLMLRDLTIGPPTMENTTLARVLRGSMNGNILRPYSFLQADFAAEMLSSGRLKITAMKRVPPDGIEVQGTSDIVWQPNRRTRHLVTAHLSEADGRFRKVTSQILGPDGKPGATAIWEYTYSVASGGIERIDYKTPQIVCRMTFSSPAKLTADPETYRASHYGIPEPMGVDWKPKRSRAFVWLLVSAGALALVAVVFRLFLWRKRIAARGALPPSHHSSPAA